MAAESSITIADESVIVDAGGEIQAFIDRYLPVQDWLFNRHELPKPIANPFERASDNQWCKSPLPQLPACRLNQLIWPTGASRYARALLLVDYYSFIRIIQKAWNYKPPKGSASEDEDAPQKDAWPDTIPEAWVPDYKQNKAVRVKFFGDDTVRIKTKDFNGNETLSSKPHVFEADMFVLSPLRVPAFGVGLFVLPLVDKRYFARQKVVSLISSDVASYRPMLLKIGRDLKLAPEVCEVAAEYGQPDKLLQGTPWPGCDLFDVVTQSVGMRNVYWPTEQKPQMSSASATSIYQLETVTADVSAERRKRNLANTLQIAGGPIGSSGVFDRLRIRYYGRDGKPKENAIDLDGPLHGNDSSGLDIVVWSGWDEVAASSESKINQYVSRFRDDLRSWLRAGGVYTFQGPVNYEPSGFDDYYSIEFFRDPSGAMIFRSVIHELPPVVLPDVVLPCCNHGLYTYTLLSDWGTAIDGKSGFAWPVAKCRVAPLWLEGAGPSINNPSVDGVNYMMSEDEADYQPVINDVLECHSDMTTDNRGVCVRRGRAFYTIDTPCTEN